MDDWLVSVCKNGKVIELYYSYELKDIDTIRALHPGCLVETMCVYKSEKQNVQDVGVVIPKQRYVTKRVKCVETGEEYKSVSSCSSEIGESRWTVYKAVQVGYEINGKHYKYID